MEEETTTINYDIKVLVKEEVLNQIEWLIENYEQEIGAWLCGEVKENQILVDDLLFYDQEVSQVSVDVGGKQLIKMRQLYGNKCLRIIGHFHSHNTMKAFWSSTDEEFIKQYADVRDLSLFIVSSKPTGHRVRVEIRKPFKISLDNIGLTKLRENEKDIESQMRKVISDFVKEKKIEYTYKPSSVDYGSDWENYNKSYWGNVNYSDENSWRQQISDELEQEIEFNSDYYPQTKTYILREVEEWYKDDLAHEFKDFKFSFIKTKENYNFLIKELEKEAIPNIIRRVKNAFIGDRI